MTPAPVQRLEAFRIPDWERQGSNWRVPRSSLAPILRFADLDALRPGERRRRRGSTRSSRSASRARTSPTTCVSSAGRTSTSRPLVGFGLGEIARQTGKNGTGRPNHGVLAPVRTYESPADRRLEEAGFAEIATVTLLLKETLVRVAEPSLVPAAVRPWEVTRGS